LAKIGVKNYIIEKPLTDSFYELNEMQQLINSMNLTVKTNLPILYSDVPRRLLDFEKTYGIGRPRSMIVYGGAKCIATIGIHYVALANYLYNNRPSAVSAVLRSHRINPRNDKLVYLEGGAQWVYPHDQYLSINFSNTSQLDFKCSILYKNAEVVIHNQNLVLNKISSQDLLLLDKPTKTSSASETILDLSVNTQEDFMRSLHSIYESFTKTESSLDGKWGFAATYDLLSALTANKLQRVIRLPLDKNLIEHYYQKKWGIS
jgi:predicted dehydrogenase